MLATTEEIQAALAEPFPVEEVMFRPNVSKDGRGMSRDGRSCICFAYIDARSVMDRLDSVVGMGRWKTEYAPVDKDTFECKLSLLIDGQWICRSDVGERAQNQQLGPGDQVKAAYSDALKRAAVQFGVFRYGYALGTLWAEWDSQAKRISQPPKLPDWAIPAKQKKAAPAQSQTPAKAQNGYSAQVVQWFAFFRNTPSLKQVNDTLRDLSKLTQKDKEIVWAEVNRYATELSWEFDGERKIFLEPVDVGQ